MIEFREIANNVWLYPGADGKHNSAVVLAERAALLVDPDTEEMGKRAVARFLEENAPGVEVRAVAFTQGTAVDPPWPNAHTLRSGEPQNGVSLSDLIPGWVSFGLGGRGGDVGGRLGLYNGALRLLFCGSMLIDPQIAIPDLQSGSQEYLDALTQIEGLDVKLAVSSFGSLAVGKRAVRARIEGDRNYIHSVLRHLLTTQAAGVPLERALKIAEDIYSSFPYLQDHLANMRNMWDELE